MNPYFQGQQQAQSSNCLDQTLDEDLLNNAFLKRDIINLSCYGHQNKFQKNAQFVPEQLHSQNVQVLKKLWDQIHIYKQQTNDCLAKIIEVIGNSILRIEKEQQVMKELGQRFRQKQIHKVQMKKMEKLYDDVYSQILEQFNQLEAMTQTKSLFESINQLDSRLNNEVQYRTLSCYDQYRFKEESKIEAYKTIQEIEVSDSNQICKAIAFNSEGSIMILGLGIQIFVYKQQSRIYKLDQVLDYHFKDINCLIFKKSSNQFISAGSDKNIFFFQQNTDDQWQKIEELQGHQEAILSLVINKNDDLLISGGCDKNIKFWVNQTNWQCTQTLNFDFFINGLSLNESENRLICCGFDSQEILVIDKNECEQWIIAFRIQVEKFGYRICFIKDDRFIFQPEAGSLLLCFKITQQNEFKIEHQMIVNKTESDIAFFPQSYIKDKNIIFSKSCSCLNILQHDQNDNLKVLQTIELQTCKFFGGVSDNGMMLAMWDDKTKVIQVRQLKQFQ